MRLLRGTSSDALPLAFACVVVGALLAAMTAGGPFTNDEAHYLATITALKHGTFRLESTAGLMASRELLSFGAYNFFYAVKTTPVAPVAPPLYAFLALPFSYLGFRALIWLNTASFLATGVMVFHFAKRCASRRLTAWVALALYWFASFSIEYALGMWPHGIAVMLCTGATLLVLRASDDARGLFAAVAGVLIGIATGVRYQEIVFGGLLGVTLLYWTISKRRALDGRYVAARATEALRLAGAYVVGICGPLAVSAYINHARLGSWSPITKGAGYGEAGDAKANAPPAVVEWIWTFAMKVFDFSLCPPFAQIGEGENYRPSTLSGAVVYGGVVKKALLQSSPWMMLALLGLALSWRTVGGLPARGRRELRGLSILVFGVIAAFSVAGLGRTDGFCFNMRYFLELMPLGAIATAWIVQRYLGWKPVLVVSALVGAVPALATFGIPMPMHVHHLIILRAPLVLAALLAVAALHARKTDRGKFLAPAFAACVGWAVIVHVGDDVLASLKIRAKHEYYTDIVATQIDREKTALIAYWGATTPFSPLTLTRDLTIVDPFLDRAATTRPLVDELLAKGFRVVVLPQKMPREVYDAIVEGKATRELWADQLVLVEVSSPRATSVPDLAPAPQPL